MASYCGLLIRWLIDTSLCHTFVSRNKNRQKQVANWSEKKKKKKKARGYVWLRLFEEFLRTEINNQSLLCSWSHMDLAKKPKASQGISRSIGTLISQAWSPNPSQMAPWWTDQTSHGCGRQLLSPAAALLVVSPHIPHAPCPRVLQRQGQQRPDPWVIADSLLRASVLTHVLRIENAHARTW